MFLCQRSEIKTLMIQKIGKKVWKREKRGKEESNRASRVAPGPPRPSIRIEMQRRNCSTRLGSD